MIVVADSSPLIVLAKLNCLHLLHRLFDHLCISAEVHYEVVVAGAGLPGASEVAQSEWIKVTPLNDKTSLPAAQARFGLGAGELSTIFLGKELSADVILLDDLKARQLAKQEGLEVRGSVGLLETFYRQGHVSDLRAIFRQLLIHEIYIDKRLLNRRLQSLGLPDL